jgi:hypothetical protein
MAGRLGAKLGDEVGGPRVGFTCAGVGLMVARVYLADASIMRVGYKHPRVKPTRGAPWFLNDREYCSNGIFSSTGHVMWKEKCAPRPPATCLFGTGQQTWMV